MYLLMCILGVLYRLEVDVVSDGASLNDLLPHVAQSAMALFVADSNDIVRYDALSRSFEGLQSACHAGLPRTWEHAREPTVQEQGP